MHLLRLLSQLLLHLLLSVALSPLLTLGSLLLLLLDELGLFIIRKPHGNVLSTAFTVASVEVDTTSRATRNDDALHLFLLQRTLTDPFFNCVARDESVHRDLSCLTQSVRSVHGLRVNGRVPIGVVEYDRVCGSQVDTKTTSTGRQQEHEDFRPLLEVRNRVPTILQLRASVQAAVLVVPVRQVLLHEIDHTSHLEVQQYTVTTRLELA